MQLSLPFSKEAKRTGRNGAQRQQRPPAARSTRPVHAADLVACERFARRFRRAEGTEGRRVLLFSFFENFCGFVELI